MKTKVAPRLTALDMYGITTYSQYKHSGIPAYPDMEDVQRAAENVIKELDSEMWSRELENIVEPLQNLKSDFGCDTDELDNFLEEADQVVCNTKTCVIDAISILSEAKGDITLPDYVVECIERATERLHDALPESTLYANNCWLRRSMNSRMIELLDSMMVASISFSTSTDDPHDNVFVHKRGDVKIEFNGAKLYVWRGHRGIFYITADRLYIPNGKHSFEGDALYSMFSSWTNPTDEEIQLFNMVYPNVPSDIWKFLKDYAVVKKPNPDI